MALEGSESRFMYSGAASSITTQSDPLLSLGGFRGSIGSAADIVASAPYTQASLDGVSPAINKLSASTNDSGAAPVLAVGDWVMVVDGAAGPSFGKAIDVTGGVVTLDRELAALTAASDFIRFSKVQNVFPNVTLAQVSTGLTDYRMLYFYQNVGAGEDAYRFWLEPVKANGCTIDIMPSGDGEAAPNAPTIASETTSPFTTFGHINGRAGFTAMWDLSEESGHRTSESVALPQAGSEAIADNEAIGIWLSRTIPAGATGGECVFALFCQTDADPTPNPDPFFTGFLFSFTIPETTYNISIAVDRLVYIGGAARVTATITDQLGVAVPNLNAWIVIDSGPGTIDTNINGRTDSLGQIKNVYTAPTVVTVDPVFKVNIPTNPEI